MTFYIFCCSSCERGCEFEKELLDFKCIPDKTTAGPEQTTVVQKSDESTKLKTTTEKSKPRRPSTQNPSNYQPGTQNAITTAANQCNDSPLKASGPSQPIYYYYQLPVPEVQSQPNYQPVVQPPQRQPNVIPKLHNPVKQYDCDPLINNLIHFAHKSS